MKKTDAVKEAEKIFMDTAREITCIVDRLGKINTQAFDSSGILTHTKRQIRALRVVAKELSDLAELADWEVDADKTLQKDIQEGEAV